MQGQNPLDQLRPNHLPDPIGIWPPAIGWWVLAALIMLMVTGIGYWLIRRWKNNHYRRQGVKQANHLLALYSQHKNSLRFAHDCNRLLKQVALHAYPQKDVAGLHGQQWQAFLAEKGQDQQFINGAGEAFGEGRFSPDWTPDIDALHKLTLSWIKKHHA